MQKCQVIGLDSKEPFPPGMTVAVMSRAGQRLGGGGDKQQEQPIF
jgi:hypothetical protein